MARRRPLTYSAARRMFARAQGSLGSDWILHDLRNSAAERMIADSTFILVDVQTVLRHTSVTTTTVYPSPRWRTCWRRCSSSMPAPVAGPQRAAPPPPDAPRRAIHCSTRDGDRPSPPPDARRLTGQGLLFYPDPSGPSHSGACGGRCPHRRDGPRFSRWQRRAMCHASARLRRTARTCR